MKLIENLCYAVRESEALHLDLYLPDEPTFDLFVYFHGGGLERGHKAKTAVKVFAPWLAQRGIAVASCDYRKYPTAAYPDFICDAAEAVAWLSSHIRDYGDCKGLFVGGSSAGGYLSMMLCYDGRWLGAHAPLPTPIAGYFHDAGQPTAHFRVLRERGIDQRRVIVDDTAPLYHIGVLESYPPQMFVVSDNDMRNRLEQTQLVLSTLRHFGYDEKKLSFRLMHGKHVAYCAKTDEVGDSVFGKMIWEWIRGLRGSTV